MNPEDEPFFNFTHTSGFRANSQFYDQIFREYARYQMPTYTMVKIITVIAGNYVEVVVPMDLDELDNLGDRINKHTPSERESFRKRWERDTEEARRRSEPRFDYRAWEAQQEARRQERVREENARRAEEARERQRQQQSYQQSYQQRTREQYQAWERLQEEFKRTASGFQGFTDAPMGGAHQRKSRTRLAEIAGVEDWSELDDRTLLRRAQRKAHPDTGGTHELWLEVDEIRRYLKL